MTRHFRRALAPAVLLAVVSLPGPARALKIDTHVWVAQQVLNDLWPDCALTVEPLGDFAVDPGICEMLKANPSVFRMGAIGPDGFPDVVGGQMTTHPGPEGMWGADAWLKHLFEEAAARGGDRSQAYAFSLGYGTHVAADIFSHSYVNTYAGDYFELTDGEVEVELRHMALEDFVRSHTPPVASPQGVPVASWQSLDIPAEFVRDAVLMNAGAADQYGRQASTWHLAAMYAYRAKLEQVLAVAERAQAEVNSKIGDVQGTIQDAQDYLGKEYCTPFGCVRWCWFVDPISCELTLASLEGAQRSLGVLQELNSLITDGTVLPLRLLVADAERAMTEYERTSALVSIEIMKPDGDPFHPVTEWACNYAAVFAAVPSLFTQPGCAVYSAIDDARSAIDQFRGKAADWLGVFGWLVDPAYQVQQIIDDELKPQFQNLAADLVGAIAGQDSVLYSISAMRLKKHTEQTLDDEFAADSSSKRLLLIPDVAARAKADMHLTAAGTFDPGAYAMIKDAVVLAKLVLLGPSELSRMAHDAGVYATAYGPDLYTPTTPFSPLLEAVRSIDGNQQWQENAIPYPRLDGNADAPTGAVKSFGRAFPLGFRPWQDCLARKNVFEQVFSGPIAPGIEDPASVELTTAVARWTPSADPAPFPLAPGSRTIDLVAPTTDPYPLPAQTAECNMPIATPAFADNCNAATTTIGTADPMVYPVPGTYQVTWNLNDHQPNEWNGNAGNASAVPQTVVVKDTLPPTIKSFQYSGPLCLWAPDHKWVVLRVGEEFQAVIEDACDPAPRLVVAGAQSSQPPDANGDGTTAPDLFVGTSHVCLRSERAGGDPAGRLYTIQLFARDASGNDSDPVVQVRVSHDQSLHDCPVLPASLFVEDDDPRCKPVELPKAACGTPGVGAGGLLATALALLLARPRRRRAAA